ncbi:class I SAM-dependent methyltransferase [Sporomusa acidovorans]|uniref:Ubiquinone biosynthesis O-methyltransferase, mitochondrial n=1 Tax=Sporomusa acidovorans (strain ATCC 49682 / DSM 3132 / Mol) TaxID=1123286 RepID=A0ABZ3J6X4_SPOA4|nr:class I SAM-dependent methyltransferase [Sporomusa acidovorans]OZC19343.1 ubiquinone biosynthesis O-methyltransferase [Sporomusa acidovorans DSM 3132]SDD80125.1 Methyltransferase domain-containing protein [Sporomusa acidovorans]
MLNNCRLCGSKKIMAIKKIKSPWNLCSDLSYTLYGCSDCQSKMFDPDEHSINLNDFYNERSKNKNYLDEQFTYSKYWMHEVKTIKQYLQKDPRSILDIGCRNGDFLLHWPQGIKRVGVEIAKDFAHIAQNRGIIIINDFIENISFEEKFDIVTCYAILEHLNNPTPFMEKLNNLVSPNGILVIMVPFYDCLKVNLLDKLNIRWHMYSPPEHVNFYSEEYLDKFFNKFGFSLQQRKFTSGGMFNPLQGIPILEKIAGKLMWYVDAYTKLNKYAVFDHMYCYYVKQ